MNYRIVTDSSSNVLTRPGENYACVPLKIVAGQEYADVPGLSVTQMVEDLKTYKGKTGSSCPNVGEWLEAFGDAEFIFCITITKYLSGSYNAAMAARDMVLEDHPEKKIFVLDTLSCSGALGDAAELANTLIGEGQKFEDICFALQKFAETTHIAFNIS